MSFRTEITGQDRFASLVAPSMATTIAGAWVVCPVPSIAPAMASGSVWSIWAAMYQQAHEQANRSVRAAYPGREIAPSMN